MVNFLLLATSVGTALAMPHMNDPSLLKTARSIVERQNAAIAISKAEGNCGLKPCLGFSEAQRISTSGQYAYKAPSSSDIRGPCPGLNAAANHGYLPRNGILSIEQTVSGLKQLYGLSADVSGFLAAYAIATDGNVAEGVWSIGGPLPADAVGSSLGLGTGQGISYSHNAYEGDASIGRNDAYANNGDAHSLNITKFANVYALGGKEDRYTMDKFRSRFEEVQQESIANNPYYFTAGVGPFAVVPAAYNFVINFMSNHSAKEPNGYLDGYNFKTFFGVSGKPGSFKWLRGQERIPEDWYRRTLENEYTLADVFADLAIMFAAYPGTAKFGGNTGKTNSFVGINPSDVSGGVFHASDFTKGDSLACFVFNLMQDVLPDALNPVANAVGTVYESLAKYLPPPNLTCKPLKKFDYSFFNSFPGRKYSPTGPATNYRA